MYWDDDNYQPKPTAKVYQLRKEGQIDEAHSVAYKLYASNPSDDDYRKAFAWTLIDLCKRSYSNGNMQEAQNIVATLSSLPFEDRYDDFTETILKQIKSLRIKLDPFYSQIHQAAEYSKNGNNNEAYRIMSELAKGGNLSVDSHENYGWVIYKYLRDNIDTLTSIQVRSNLRDYLLLKNERPSNLHSQILNFALNYSKRDSQFRFVSFLKLWGPSNLRSTDFSESYGNDGKKIPSLMARIAKVVVNYPIEEAKEFIDLLPEGKEDFREYLRESYFWNIYHAAEEKRYADLWASFDKYLDGYSLSAASEWNSKILSLAERLMKEDNQCRFLQFFRKWNPDNFSRSDWLEESGENGEKYKPLAIKCLKKAFECLEALPDENRNDFNWLIDAYSKAIEKFPNDEWLTRELAKLFIYNNDILSAERIYKDLVLKLGDKYYVWYEFSKCVEDNKLQIAMLCKAVSLENNEDFIGKIRLSLAESLIESGHREEAVIEAHKYKSHYEQKGWKIDDFATAILSDNTITFDNKKDNKSLYDEYIPKAETYAYSDIPETNVVCVDEWKSDDGKRHIKFTDGEDIEVSVTPKKFPALSKAKKGQVWSFKFNVETEVEEISSFSYLRKQEKVKKSYTPLLVRCSSLEDWSILPLKYGYINHINPEKKAYHIYNQESNLIFEHFETQQFQKGDYVSFRQFKKVVKDETKTEACCLTKVDEEEALQHFKSRIVGVDDVNEQKQLFHFVLGPKLISGILHYDQTPIRPKVGDFLKITYYVREKKEVKKPGDNKKVVEVLRVEQTDEVNDNIVRNISGLLELKYKGEKYDWYDDEDGYGGYGDADFAFIGDYYVHKSILRKYNIDVDCRVSAKAIYTGDGKWKVYEITPNE